MNQKIILGIVSSLVMTSAAFASSTTTFGPLPDANWSGTGNPNDPVQVTTITTGGSTITLGLAAQQRYYNAPLGNNGAGTYYAGPGSNMGDPNPINPQPSAVAGATWNFDFYVKIEGGPNFGNYTFKLLYDFTPGTGTPDAQLGTINLNSFVPSSTTLLQDSENLQFGFLTTGIPGITPPSGGSTTFDPNAPGEYSFALQAFDSSGAKVGESRINVDVVPEVASSAVLLCLGMGGLLAFASRKRVTA